LGVEIPLRFSVQSSIPEGAAESEAARMDESGVIRVCFRERAHRFGLESSSLVLLDREGQAVPYQVRITTDRRTRAGALPSRSADSTDCSHCNPPIGF